MTTTKPLILPLEIVWMLRGERGYIENVKDVAKLGISYYQDGKAGKSFRFDLPPSGMFSPRAVEGTDCFLLACWEQGREDAASNT